MSKHHLFTHHCNNECTTCCNPSNGHRETDYSALLAWWKKKSKLSHIFVSSEDYVSRALSTFAPVKNGTFALKMTHLPRDF